MEANLNHGWVIFTFRIPSESLSPVKNREPYFKTSKEFHNTSYTDRYKEFCKRLVRERLYDSSCLLIANSDQGSKEPLKKLIRK
ncbi:type-2 restriction enzyme PaeR7I domain protein [Leptospira weilii serovar Topaz str. LT2116]|uniref:Type-2 restriction enzyme PaeR7I domain protein n=1 Tax=Leptospira weilii serovar Topaz str. LT2116 TaxID=1088540 RepID=M3ELG5_9LEPT|nr:type-2 restriction enzyme PaeR7I domain protein [Leptospira weilii serovar Topaz str. LT2116]